MKTWYIGIDTGVKTGFAFNDNGKLTSVKTLPIHQALVKVRTALTLCVIHENKLHIVVEDARKRKWFGDKGREALQGAGSVKRDAKIWEDYLTELRNKYPDIISFEMVSPAANKTKLSKEVFAQLTGWTERTSEHGRDAAMLVWGRK